MLVILLIVVAFALLLFLHKICVPLQVGPKEPPLVSGWIPYFGVALEYGLSPKHFLKSMRAKYGNIFSIYIAGKIITMNLNKDFYRNFYKATEEELDFFNGLSAVSLDKALGPTFHPKRAVVMMGVIQNKFIPMIPKFLPSLIDELNGQIPKLISSNAEVIDIWKMMNKLVTALSLRCICSPCTIDEDFINAIIELETQSQKLLQRPGIFGLWTLYKCTQMRNKMYKILRPEIAKRRKLMKEGAELPEDLLSITLQEGINDERAVLDSPVGILFGALANTNAVATLVLCHLLIDRTLLEAARDEISEVKKKFNEITYESLSHLHFLDACSLEVTRLYAILMSVRKTGTPMKLDKYEIPANRFLAISSWLGMQDPDVFHSPEKYDPYRFVKDSASYSAEQSRYFTGFGGGRHICKGMMLARMELKIILMKLLEEYEFEFEGPIPPLEWISLGVSFPKTPVLFRYKKIEPSEKIHRIPSPTSAS